MWDATVYALVVEHNLLAGLPLDLNQALSLDHLAFPKLLSCQGKPWTHDSIGLLHDCNRLCLQALSSSVFLAAYLTVIMCAHVF